MICLTSSNIFVSSWPDFFNDFSDFTALQLKFVCVTSFLLLGRLRESPRPKEWLLSSFMELCFMNIY